jgi:hypothetical protein
MFLSDVLFAVVNVSYPLLILSILQTDPLGLSHLFREPAPSIITYLHPLAFSPSSTCGTSHESGTLLALYQVVAFIQLPTPIVFASSRLTTPME